MQNNQSVSSVFISVVIPVYHGEKTVEALFGQIKDFFENELKESYEVIFVHDRGPDNSWNVITGLKKQNPSVIKAIQLTRNYGQHNALICGFKHASGKWVVTMDEDLQHLPKDISKLLQKQKEADFDIVYGKYEILKHNIFRNFTSVALKNILAWGIPELHPDYSAYRLIRADIAKYCTQMNNSYTFLDGYLSWISNNTGSVEVTHSERMGGKSSYTFKKLLNHSINILTTFSNLPIRILSSMSILVFILSLLYSLYILFRKFIYDDILPGYASLVIILGFSVGCTLLGMGILGEYIYRINQKTTHRPNYIEGKILDDEQQ